MTRMTTRPSRKRSSKAHEGHRRAPTWTIPSIDYRERSPLVVPPKLDLPPPASAAAERRRRTGRRILTRHAARRRSPHARRKRTRTPRAAAGCRSAAVAERAQRRADEPAPATQDGNDRSQPGDPNDNPLSPSQLGFNGGLSGCSGGNKAEATPFKGEPPRESLTAAAAGLSDAVAELCLWHRAEGIR